MSSLEDAKVGDKIIVPLLSGRYLTGPKISAELLVVARITPAQVVCGRRRFRKKDGYEIGVSSTFNRAELATPEQIEKCESERVARDAWDLAFRRSNRVLDVLAQRKATTEQMNAIADAYEKTLEKAE